MVSQKRSLPSDDIDDSDTAGSPSASTSTTPRHFNKRRRCSTLERGFAGLTLGSSGIAPAHNTALPSKRTSNVSYPASRQTLKHGLERIPSPPSSFRPATPMETDGGDAPSTPPHIIRAAYIEEPTSPDEHSSTMPEIKMHSSSWYEPEKDRIVITDLDAVSSDEDDSAAVSDIAISPAFLDRLKNPGDALPKLPRILRLEPDPSTALVLFKPLGIPEGEKADRAAEDKVQGAMDAPPAPILPVEDDDAMDIEL